MLNLRKRLLKTLITKPQQQPLLVASPWTVIQQRGSKIMGGDIRPGNVIIKKGRLFEVIKADHNMHGRGGAIIQAEIRDMETGNKVIERFRTSEALDSVFVSEKKLNFLYSEGDTVVLMEPDTYEQMDVSKDLFGKSAAYLKDEMEVTLQLCDERVMSASVPARVTCTVAEATAHVKGLTAAPQFKKVKLDNGITVSAPAFVEEGDKLVINTTDDSYVTRFKG